MSPHNSDHSHFTSANNGVDVDSSPRRDQHGQDEFYFFPQAGNSLPVERMEQGQQETCVPMNSTRQHGPQQLMSDSTTELQPVRLQNSNDDRMYEFETGQIAEAAGIGSRFQSVNQVQEGNEKNVLFDSPKRNGQPYCENSRDVPPSSSTIIPSTEFWSRFDFDLLAEAVRKDPEVIMCFPWHSVPENQTGKFHKLWQVAEETRRRNAVIQTPPRPTQQWPPTPKKNYPTRCETCEEPAMWKQPEPKYEGRMDSVGIGQKVAMMGSQQEPNPNELVRLGPFPPAAYGSYSPSRPEFPVRDVGLSIQQQQQQPTGENPFPFRGQEQQFQHREPFINRQPENEGRQTYGPSGPTPLPHPYESQQACPRYSSNSMHSQVQPHLQREQLVPRQGYGGQVDDYEERFEKGPFYNAAYASQVSGFPSESRYASMSKINESNTSSERGLNTFFYDAMSINASADDNWRRGELTGFKSSPISFKTAGQHQQSPVSEFGFRSGQGDRAPETNMTLSPPARTLSYNPVHKKYEYECVFCKGNNMTETVYKSHPIRLGDTVLCPYLRSHVCGICGATGDKAHTIKYCPHNDRGFFARGTTTTTTTVQTVQPKAPVSPHSGEGYAYVAEIGINFGHSGPSEYYAGRKREPVARKLNFDDMSNPNHQRNSVFFKRLQNCSFNRPDMGRYQ